MAIKYGTLVSFASGAFTASIRMDEAAAQAIENVRVSRAIPGAEMVTGRRVLLDTGDHNDPSDLVLYAIVS
ncbi:MAG: hypothetical protein IT303_13170 [Dehalococcoidia bacterium]|nr:hypothetical protein [Dehalococcoidia bacterium]